MSIKNVTIVGGGIGGLTLAHSLRKVGINSKVYEAYPWKENLGSGIGLWKNSMKIYSNLGLKDELVKHGSWMDKPSYRNMKGEILAKPTDRFGEKFTVLCLHRSDLQKTLLQPLEGLPDVLHSGMACEKFTQTADAITAHFAGGQTVTSDLLVGCDGIHSRIRAQMEPGTDYEPQYLGYTYYRATVDLTESEYDALTDSFESWGEGKRFGYVPLKKPQVFWFASIPAEPLKRGDPKWGVPEFKKKLLEMYSHWHHPIPKLVNATPESHIFRTDIYKVPTMEKWFDGRAVLLGDACHATAPNLAQGAGLSIEDCAELAKCLQLLNEGKLRSLDEALLEYQDRRIPRAKTVQTIADLVAFVGQLKSPWITSTRDSFMKYFPNALRARIFDASVSYSLGWNYEPPTLSEK